MARIFLSYRREDSAAHAGRLYDRLGARYGKANVFMDIDAIELGEDFVSRIARTVRACDVLIALIGRNWLAATDAEGRRRLDVADDIVRMEIGAALERDIRVIPLLVGGANMPAAAELPESLAQLTRRNGLQISDARFHEDVDRLVEAIDRVVPSPASESRVTLVTPKSPRRTPRHKSAAIVILAVLAVLTTWQIGRSFQDSHVIARPALTEERFVDHDNRFDSSRVGSRLSNFSPSTPSLDVETMRIKRSIEANAQREAQMRRITDKYNRTAKSIIDSMGR